MRAGIGHLNVRIVGRTGWVATLGLCTALALPAPGVAQATPVPAAITPTTFAGMSWLEGRWLGSGGGFDAFYEAYRMVNDSTMEQTTYPDSTFATPDGRSLVELRGGHVLKSRNGQVESMITRLAGDTIRFDRTEAGRPGFTWIRISDDEWQAVLERGNRDPVVYVLRRIPQNER